MASSKERSLRKESGGRYRKSRDKKKYALAGEPTLTKLGAPKFKSARKMGGALKFRVLTTNIANVIDAKTKKHNLAKILTIVENPANAHFVRRNIMTKGTVIETEFGKAKVTSRPGQDGIVNAVLLQ